MRWRDGDWSDVVAINLESGSFGVEMHEGVAGSNFAGFAGQQRKIIVVPENGDDVFGGFTLGEAQVDHEDERITSIADGHAGDGVAGVLFVARRYAELHLR